jgi:hypothetical protein
MTTPEYNRYWKFKLYFMRPKFERILTNYLNGNKFDARKGMKGLTKVELVDFIKEASVVHGTESVLAIVSECLK